MMSWLGYLLRKKEKIERVEGTTNDNEKEKKEEILEPNEVEGLVNRWEGEVFSFWVRNSK